MMTSCADLHNSKEFDFVFLSFGVVAHLHIGRKISRNWVESNHVADDGIRENRAGASRPSIRGRERERERERKLTIINIQMNVWRKEKMEKKTVQVNLKYVVETEEAEEAKETEESAQRGEADEGAAKEEKMMKEPQKATATPAPSPG